MLYNRTTFYQYFEDTFHLLSYMEDSIVSYIQESIVTRIGEIPAEELAQLVRSIVEGMSKGIMSQ